MCLEVSGIVWTYLEGSDGTHLAEGSRMVHVLTVVAWTY
jgi:hypothetical protein